MRINLMTLALIGVPLIALSSFVFAYIQGYFVLNVVYFLFVAGVLAAVSLLGVRHETREITWQEALKNIEPVSQKFKVSRGVQPKVLWGTMRSDMRRYSSSGKVWDIQMEAGQGNAAISQDAKSGRIVGFDFNVGTRSSPIAMGLWESNMPPQFVPPAKSLTKVETKTER